MKKRLLLLMSVFFTAHSIYTQTTITIQPSASTGKDAIIANCIPCGYSASNFGTHPDFMAVAWTNGGAISNARALIEFDLSAIPSGSVITNAELSLYHYFSPFNIGHSQLGGSNSSYLRRITQSWQENTISWDNQPSTTTQNQVLLNASANDSIDYLNISVIALLNDIFNNPSQGYGMMLALDTEVNYRSLLFASSDNLNSALHPKLVITYVDSSSVGLNHTNIENKQWLLFPNPNNGIFSIQSKDDLEFVELYDLNGRKIYSSDLKNSSNIQKFDFSLFSNGIYYLRMGNEKNAQTEKLIIQK
jgi:Secretion system C-terminal sorting domain